MEAPCTNHSLSTLAFARLDFEIRSAPLEGTKRITVHFYLQAGHEGDVGVNVVLKKTRVPAAAQIRITPQSAISFQALHHDWLRTKSIPDCQRAQIRVSGPLPIKERRCFGAITAAVQTAAKEEQQQQQQRFPPALILKLRVPSWITYSLCRIHGALDDRGLQEETEIIEKLPWTASQQGQKERASSLGMATHW